jgi:hypothetical protein
MPFREAQFVWPIATHRDRPLALRVDLCHCSWSAGAYGQVRGDFMSLSATPNLCVPNAREPAATALAGPFDALGHAFAVHCEDDTFASILDESFRALAVSKPALGEYRISRCGDAFELTWCGRLVVGCTDRAGVLAWLHYDVNRRAVAAADADLVLHAGCVARGDQAIVVSGPSGSGKSTLVAALVAAGLDYLTDEAVPVDFASGRVRAFPRPATLDDRSIALVRGLVVRDELRDGTNKRVIAISPRTTWRERDYDVTLVVFPERAAGDLVLTDPVSRGEAVVRLAENAFNFPRHGRDAIDVLARMMDHAVPCRIVGGDPRAAARSVIQALDAVNEPGQPTRTRQSRKPQSRKKVS